MAKCRIIPWFPRSSRNRAVEALGGSAGRGSSHHLRYIRPGTAWVLKDANCILQYQIDDEQIATDGKVNKRIMREQ
jgi:hypothetical protein